MSTRLEIFGLAAAAITAGTIYVMVHEARRKHKKALKLEREAPISKEMLLKILNKSADASRAVIDRVTVSCARARPAAPPRRPFPAHGPQCKCSTTWGGCTPSASTSA